MKVSTKVAPLVTSALAFFLTREAGAIYLPGMARLYRGDGDLTDAANAGEETSLYTIGNGVTYPNEIPFGGVYRKVMYFNHEVKAFGSAAGLPKRAESRTIMGWVKNEVTGDLVHHTFGYGKANCNESYTFWIRTNKQFDLDQYCVDEQTSGNTLEHNTWYHLAATYDDNSGYESLYRNGERVGHGIPDAAPNTQTDTESVVSIGGPPNVDPDFTYGTYKGHVADFAIFNRALTADEIRSVFDSEDGLESQPPLTLGERYAIALVPGSTILAFKDPDKEMTFSLKIAKKSVNELDLITILDYVDCKNDISVGIISARIDLNDKVVDADDRYWDVPIRVDIKTNNFDNGPDGYFTRNDETNEVNLKFCVKSEMGATTVVNLDENGNVIAGSNHTSSVSYMKVKFDVTIDMETNFESNVDIKEEGAVVTGISVENSYTLEAYECYTDGERIINPEPKNQNSMINICISTPVDNDVVITDITDLKLKSDKIASFVIDNNVTNPFTTVVDISDKKKVVSTQLVTAFYTGLDSNATANITVEGTALMGFPSSPATRSRKLVRSRSTNLNNSTMDRKLDEEDSVNKFKMEVGISGANSAVVTSGASTTSFSVVPSTTMTSLALVGGALICFIF